MKKIVRYIKQKFFEPRIIPVASKEVSLDEIRKFIGPDTENLSNEEIQKLFTSLPVEKQVTAFFGKKTEN